MTFEVTLKRNKHGMYCGYDAKVLFDGLPVDFVTHVTVEMVGDGSAQLVLKIAKFNLKVEDE